jgi:hypothetical protein
MRHRSSLFQILESASRESPAAPRRTLLSQVTSASPHVGLMFLSHADAPAVRSGSCRRRAGRRRTPFRDLLAISRTGSCNERADDARRDRMWRRRNVTGPQYTASGDPAHLAHVSQGSVAMSVYRVMRQHVKEYFLLLPSLPFRLIGEKSQQKKTDVRRCLLREDTTTTANQRKRWDAKPRGYSATRAMPVEPPNGLLEKHRCV